MTLTALQVQAAKPRSKPYELPDGNGLFLWVTTDARKILALPLPLRGYLPSPRLTYRRSAHDCIRPLHVTPPHANPPS